MRHRKGIKKLNKPTDQRLALLRNSAKSLIDHSRITTTDVRAKQIKRFIEKLITISKNDSVHAKREVFKSLQDREYIKKLSELSKSRYLSRNGGYTRIIKKGFRKGDASLISILEFVN